MIIDSIENIGKYTASFPALSEVEKALETAAAREAGTYDDSLRCSVSEYRTRAKGTKGYETHRHATDVQIILSGEEIIDICENAGMKARSEYDAENDIQFFDGELALRYIARPGKFIVLFPGEGHEPNLSINEPTTVRKIVFKLYNLA